MPNDTFLKPRRGVTREETVRRLQRDLDSLGFKILGKVDGNFGRRTFWALREFQTYAAGLEVARVARQADNYVGTLESVITGANRYTGHISGVLNPETLAAIEHWKASNWRCPVVINACHLTASGRKITVVAENVWLHTDYKVSSNNVGFFSHDFTNRYVNVGKRTDGSVLLGRYQKYSTYGGPLSLPPRFTTEPSEIVPLTLTGKAYAKLDSAEQKTFRVIRAVSEVECIGFFDCINAYDNAFISVGPCHWTLGLVERSSTGRQVYDGELCGTLAYYAYRASADFNK